MYLVHVRFTARGSTFDPRELDLRIRERSTVEDSLEHVYVQARGRTAVVVLFIARDRVEAAESAATGLASRCAADYPPQAGVTVSPGRASLAPDIADTVLLDD
ncbi:hypothetical protein BX285_5353 [Streptomyces sp. 1114.5]|uniref:hypothetical protein n=1 Tax=unclassified Streptomyces TaxID=2593676 RepID=UPI000BCB7268|nr:MULTISPECIES: hypothetical protein [unclassified Streptomyces]RKT11405.1 hypothetical protein BX285_5353 [Streptomyces sp. 1114.5]SOB81233.1 hypothetical protein SAMN06272789_1358 [Streptomyces sp. 1331.2]